MKISQEVYFFHETITEKGISSNTYAIVDRGVTIIDPGHYSNLASLLHSMRVDGLSPADIKFVISTHAHGDHCTANAELKKQTGTSLLMSKDDTEFLPTAARIAELWGDDFPDFTVDRFLGSELTTGELTFVVIPTPGHTPGGVCLYEPKNKILFSGDTVFPGGSIGRTDLEGGDIDQLVSSIEKLVLLDVEILCGGHMDISVAGVPDQLRASLAFAKSLIR